MDSEVQELVKYVTDHSGAVPVQGKGHLKLVKDNFTVILPVSPSDRRWRKNAIRDLRRAGMIDKDPRAATPSISAEARERGRETQAMHVAERKRRLDLLRAKGQRTLSSVGVWKPPRRGSAGGKGTVAEAARVAWWWAGLPPQDGLWRPSSSDSARNAWVSFQKGGVPLDGKMMDWIEGFLDDLNTAPVVRSRYLSHLMESQKVDVVRNGAVDHSALVPAAELPDPEEKIERTGMTEKGIRFAFELSTYTSASTPEDRERLVAMLERVARRCG